MTKASFDRRQVLQRRSANVCGAQPFRQARRQRYGRIHWRARKRIMHGLSHAFGAAHLNKVVMYECDF